jgi:cell wall-associated NlpC family hydrolase
MVMKYFILVLYLIVYKAEIAAKEDNLSGKIQEKLLEIITFLAKQNYRYGSTFTENSLSVVLDASGATQYLYKKALNIDLPRDSFSQYTMLVQKNKLQVPVTDFATGVISTDDLKEKLKVGDLLFWTNTYEEIPENRNPPIGHVMIYYGLDIHGNMQMIGSNTWSKGYINERPGGGPDIYLFDPNIVMGCAKREEKGNRKSKCQEGYESQFFGFGSP